MDTSQIASQLISFLGDNQDLISQFVAHPYSTTAQATDSDEQISKSDMSQILTQVAAQVSGQNLGSTETASAASALMGQSDNSIHSLASLLFGGAGAGTAAAAAPAAEAAASTAATAAKKTDSSAMMADVLAKTAVGAVSSRVFASLLTGALGLNQQQKK